MRPERAISTFFEQVEQRRWVSTFFEQVAQRPWAFTFFEQVAQRPCREEQVRRAHLDTLAARAAR